MKETNGMDDEFVIDDDDEFVIDDMETLEILMDPVRLEILENLAYPHSVGEVAEAMGVPRTRLYHHFKLLDDTGIIRVVDSRQSGAVNEKLYRAAARSYQPGQQLFESAAPRDQAAAVIDMLFAVTRTDFLRSVEEKRFHLDDEAAHNIAIARRQMHITDTQAKDLVTRLNSLFEEFQSEKSDRSETYAAVTIVYPSSRIEQ